MFFLDRAHGWLVELDHARHESYVFRTRDGGRTWKGWRAPRGLYRLYFLSARSGWGVTRPSEPEGHIGKAGAATAEAPAGTHVVRTLDGGKTWARLSAQPLAQDRWTSVSALAFADSERGWGCGSTTKGWPEATVLETSDGGKSSHALLNLPRDAGGCYGVYFRPSAGLWIYGGGFVLHSKDEGKTWEVPRDVAELGIDWVYSAAFFDDGRGWLVGHGPGWSVLSTTDFGRDWQPARGADPQAILNSVWFSDAAHGCAVGNSTVLLCTSDGGSVSSGRKVLPGPEAWQFDDFTRVAMLASGRGWVLRFCGILYQTIDSGQTWRPFDPLLRSARP